MISSRFFLALCLFGTFAFFATASWSNYQQASFVGLQESFTSAVAATNSRMTRTPYDICVNNLTGKIFVVSVNDNRVMRFANYAQFLCGGAAEIILGQQDFTSNGPNLFLFPVGCSLNPEQDILWVVDPGNNRVLGWDDASNVPMNAAPTRAIGQVDLLGDSPNQGNGAPCQACIANPFAVVHTSYGDTLYVADGDNQRVLAFDGVTTGLLFGPNATRIIGQTAWDTHIETNGKRPANPPINGTLGDTLGLAYHEGSDTLYVSDQVNFGRAWCRRYDHASTVNHLGATGDISQNVLIGAGGPDDLEGFLPFVDRTIIGYPRGLSVSPDGTLYLGDINGVDQDPHTGLPEGNHRVLIYLHAHTLTDTFVNDSWSNPPKADFVLGQQTFYTGLADGGLPGPTGQVLNSNRFMHVATIDGHELLFVADKNNNRILVFSGRASLNQPFKKCCVNPYSGLIKVVWKNDEDWCDDND